MEHSSLSNLETVSVLFRLGRAASLRMIQVFSPPGGELGDVVPFAN